MSIVVRGLFTIGALAVSLLGAGEARACDGSWKLSANPLSCVTLKQTSPFSYEVKNSCASSLSLSNRDTKATGTRTLDVTAMQASELMLPAPAKDGDLAVYDGNTGTDAGALRFTFSDGDCDGGCSVSRAPGGSRSSLGLGALLALGAVALRRRRSAQ